MKLQNILLTIIIGIVALIWLAVIFPWLLLVYAVGICLILLN